MKQPRQRTGSVPPWLPGLGETEQDKSWLLGRLEFGVVRAARREWMRVDESG